MPASQFEQRACVPQFPPSPSTSPEPLKNRRSRDNWPKDAGELSRAGMEIQRRPLTAQEADQIVGDIRFCPDITGYSKEEWMGGKDIFALVDLADGKLLGAILVHHLAFKWSEIAVVFVRPEYRGCGLGRYMLPTVLRTLVHTRRRLLIFFSDERMRSVVTDCGFETYDSPQAFFARHFWRGVFLRYVYKPQWLANSYRRRELRRKKRCFNADYAFRIGLYRGT
jgi:GNAT superfamily N-acetyltransferase